LRNDPQAVAANLARRGFVFDVDAFQALEEQRKQLQIESDRACVTSATRSGEGRSGRPRRREQDM